MICTMSVLRGSFSPETMCPLAKLSHLCILHFKFRETVAANLTVPLAVGVSGKMREAQTAQQLRIWAGKFNRVQLAPRKQLVKLDISLMPSCHVTREIITVRSQNFARIFLKLSFRAFATRSSFRSLFSHHPHSRLGKVNFANIVIFDKECN
jgi:hypothetical protein